MGGKNWMMADSTALGAGWQTFLKLILWVCGTNPSTICRMGGKNGMMANSITSPCKTLVTTPSYAPCFLRPPVWRRMGVKNGMMADSTASDAGWQSFLKLIRSGVWYKCVNFGLNEKKKENNTEHKTLNPLAQDGREERDVPFDRILFPKYSLCRMGGKNGMMADSTASGAGWQPFYVIL